MTVTSHPTPPSVLALDLPTPIARSRLAGLASALAGLGITVGHGLSVRSDQPAHQVVTQFAEHRSTGILGGLLVAVGAFLLLPALAGILALVRGRGSVLATVGAVMAGCGAAALGAGDVMITLVMGGLSHDYPTLATGVLRAVDAEPVTSLPFAFAPLLVLGLVLVGVGLLRGGAVPRWVAILLVVGAVLVLASPSGGLAAALILVPLGLALVLLGRHVARRRP